LAGPTHVDDHRVITAGILRQNAQTSLKRASAICHRSDGAVSTRSARILRHAESEPLAATYTISGRRTPFAHIDFDRVIFREPEPTALLLDILRQLAAQFPAMRFEVDDFSRACWPV
jgi:hypothetical protein